MSFILYSFLNGKPTLIKTSTIGLPNCFVSYKLTDGSLVNVQLMDTGGQERFRAINSTYYKKADCCLLVYDITNIKSFEDCKTYYNTEIKEQCREGVNVILLGNKTDLQSKRKVPPEEAANFAMENHYIYMETSCLKNDNVANAFEALIEITNIEAKKNGNFALYSSRKKARNNSGCSC